MDFNEDTQCGCVLFITKEGAAGVAMAEINDMQLAYLHATLGAFMAERIAMRQRRPVQQIEQPKPEGDAC